MAFLDVTYQGGPCNGRHTLLDTTQNTTGVLTCRGATYYVQPGGGANVVATLTPPATATSFRSSSAASGWADMRHVINDLLPGELVVANRYLRKALHELKHIRVRG